jgi:hypothetical protein
MADDELFVTGAIEAVVADCLMGAGFDPNELLAMTHQQRVELLRQCVADGRVPAERADELLRAVARLHQG